MWTHSMAFSMFNIFWGLILVLDASIMPVRASDPDPVTDFNEETYVSGFTFKDIFKNGDVLHGPGGTRATLNPRIYPAMMSQGITYVRFQMVPCGIDLPHTHPRASEMLTLIEGGPLQVGFVDTEGNAHIDILNPGDIVIFPRGLLHFEFNVGSETAHYLSALGSQNPGTLAAAGALFNLPARALASALNQRIADVLQINSTLYAYGGALQRSAQSGCVPGKNVVTSF
eukprot:c5337_g1_i2 orf=121-804(+)